MLKNKKVMMSSSAGGVQIFDLKTRKVDFSIEAGHAETVFDIKFASNNKDRVGSVSFDGTIRLWDANSMKLKSVIDTRHNSPIKKGCKNIIYCISWHPTESKFAISTSLGYIMVYDANKGKLLSFD